MLRQRWLLIATALPLLAMAATAPAAPVVIDFENFSLGGGMYLNVPETLIFSDVGGSGVEARIVGYDDLRVYNLLLFGGADPGANGQVLIDMDWSVYDNPAGTDITFDHPVSSFSLQAGDFGGDDDSPLSILAFDENNVQIGADSAPWPEDTEPPFATLSITAAGIRRIHWLSGGAYRNSTFIDNLTFDPAPPTATASITWGNLKQLYR